MVPLPLATAPAELRIRPNEGSTRDSASNVNCDKLDDEDVNEVGEAMDGDDWKAAVENETWSNNGIEPDGIFTDSILL